MSLQYTHSLLTIASQHLDTLVQFYQALLNQPPSPYIPNVYAEFQLIGLKLGVFQPKHAALLETPCYPSPVKGMSLCLEVENLEKAIAHLTELGYPPPGSILSASHGREIYAFDPDGNCLILHQGVSVT